MRASATCPQLATSNASRKDLATLQMCRATTILNRVVSYSSAQQEHALRTRPLSACSSPGQIAVERRKEPFEVAISQCEFLPLVFDGGVLANGLVAGNYFSFPSFEDFEEWKEEGESRNGREERDIP
jgi:hypothetical protein